HGQHHRVDHRPEGPGPTDAGRSRLGMAEKMTNPLVPLVTKLQLRNAGLAKLRLRNCPHQSGPCSPAGAAKRELRVTALRSWSFVTRETALYTYPGGRFQ